LCYKLTLHSTSLKRPSEIGQSPYCEKCSEIGESQLSVIDKS
jgi:hypothetical protein